MPRTLGPASLLVAVLIAIGAFVMEPWLAGVLLIWAIRLTILGAIVYLAVRIALKHHKQ